jgi:uncharacterized protein DUF1579
MRTISKLISVVTLVVGSATAFAQGAGSAPDAKKPPATPPAAAPAKEPTAPAPGGPPKAPEEMKQLASSMVGTWKCTGKGTMGATEIPMNGTYKVTAELDGFYLIGDLTTPKMKNGMQMKGKDIYGYDAGSKTFQMMSIDNMGGMTMMSSKGWEGEKMDWSGKAKMMGQEMDSKQTVERKSPKEVHLSGSTGSGATGMTWDVTCKK